MAEIVNAAQQSKHYSHPLFSRLGAAPKLIVVPSALTGSWQKQWASNYRCPESYKRIDAWCARNNHSEMVACLAHLHQQMRLATIAEVGRGRGARMQTAALLQMVKSHRRHRSRQLGNRLRLLNRHLAMLVAIGLARRGRGWAEFVEATEVVKDLRVFKQNANLVEDSAPKGAKQASKMASSLKVLRDGRAAEAGKKCRSPSGRFVSAKTGSWVGPDTASTPKASSPSCPPPDADVATRRAYLAALHQAEVHAAEAEAPAAEAEAPAAEAKAPAPEPRPAAKQLAPREAAPKHLAPPADPSLPDDHVIGDGTWLRDTFSRHKALASLNLISWHGTCRPRWVWRAAIGGLVARAPGAVNHPGRYVATLARQIAEGAPDPRRQPGYFALPGWGLDLLALAGV